MAENEKEERFFPVRIPKTLIEIMDKFVQEFPELGIASRQELARRAIANWIINKRRELKEMRE
ncbi:MAG: hypothetical protein ACTSRS_19020 [Candidatus Helarchaeota archaeon]